MVDHRDEGKTDSYQKWEVDKLLGEVDKASDNKIKAALTEYDVKLWKDIATQFIIQLAPMKLWIGVGKFVAVAVGLLIIGTLYQLFISLANIAGLK